jgi:hypothetical protein
MPTNAIYHSDAGRRVGWRKMSNQLCERLGNKKKIKSTERFVVCCCLGNNNNNTERHQPNIGSNHHHLDSGVLWAYTCQDL